MNRPFYTIIEDADEESVVSALQAFADMYNEQEFSQRILIFRAKKSVYRIEFPGIDEQHFLYAVNYIRYPENEAKFDSVLGYDPLGKTMYFIPKNDSEYDNCFTVSDEGTVTKHSFDGSSSIVTEKHSLIEPLVRDRSGVLLETIVGRRSVKKKGFMSWLFK